MKLFFTCALFAMLSLRSWAEDENGLSKICQQGVQATKEELQVFLKNEANRAYVSNVANCYLTCKMEKFRVFKDGGMPNEKYKMDVYTETTAMCKRIMADNYCDSAYKYIECLTGVS